MLVLAMRRYLLCSLMLAAAQSGCALPVERSARLGMEWFRDNNIDEGAKLVLGRDGTDDVRLVLMCQPHSGIVELAAVGDSGAGAILKLQSGKVWNRYPGAGHDDQETVGAVDVEVKLSAADPVLQAFADTGKLRVSFGDRRVVAPDDFAKAHDFMAVCRLPPKVG